MIVLIGESGAGKDSILNELEKIGYKRAINYTTRAKRNNDADQKNLVFITKQEFEKMWNNNKLANRAEFNNEFYGIASESLKEDGVAIAITQSIKDIKEKIREQNLDVNLKCFYIFVSEEERIKRMKNRGDSEENIEKRIEIDREKFKNAKEVVDYTIENIDLKEAVNNIRKLL